VIRFACLLCGVKYSVKPSLAGKTLKCDGCQKRMTVPMPKKAEVVEVEEVDEDVPVAEVVEAAPPPVMKLPELPEQRGLIVYGDNASVELVGTELIFRHSGEFGGRGSGLRVRAGTYRHKVLGLTEIEYTEPDLFGMGGKLRFIFGHERLDADVLEVFDTQTVTFNAGQGGDFLHFKKEVERFRRRLIAEIRMK